jgi:hypothetical protein
MNRLHGMNYELLPSAPFPLKQSLTVIIGFSYALGQMMNWCSLSTCNMYQEFSNPKYSTCSVHVVSSWGNYAEERMRVLVCIRKLRDLFCSPLFPDCREVHSPTDCYKCIVQGLFFFFNVHFSFCSGIKGFESYLCK